MRKTIIAKPKPAKDLSKVFYGWLMPDGKLYPCAYREHDDLAQGLGYRHGADLEERGGAIKLMNEAMFNNKITENSFFISQWDRLTWEVATQAQRDAMFDYAVAHNVELSDVAVCLDCP